jgi:hypothetical protein
MNNKGRISFSVEALHETDDIFFDFLEENFKIIEVDHSDYEIKKIVHLILQDKPDKFYFIHSEEPYYEYKLVVDKQGDIVKIRVELV